VERVGRLVGGLGRTLVPLVPQSEAVLPQGRAAQAAAALRKLPRLGVCSAGRCAYALPSPFSSLRQVWDSLSLAGATKDAHRRVQGRSLLPPTPRAIASDWWRSPALRQRLTSRNRPRRRTRRPGSCGRGDERLLTPPQGGGRSSEQAFLPPPSPRLYRVESRPFRLHGRSRARSVPPPALSPWRPGDQPLRLADDERMGVLRLGGGSGRMRSPLRGGTTEGCSHGD
jgi:hypothetical protein